MNRTCKTCKSMCKYKVWAGISGDYQDMLEKKQGNDELVLGVYNGVQGYGIYREPDSDSVTCNNRFSPFYNSGISKNNTCDCWESKKNIEKHGLDIFDNYKCDGQLVFEFNRAGIEIVEEK